MMHSVTVGDRRYLQFPRLRNQPGLVHAFSARPQNLSPKAPDGTAARAAMAADWGLLAENLHYCQQVHRPDLAIVTSASGGLVPERDGLVTSLADVGLMTFSADCPLVLAYDAQQHVVGMVHASWRCTVAHAAHRLIEAMRQTAACAPAHLQVGVGPGAGPCCYEVHADVYEAAGDLRDRDQVFVRRDGRMYFDLWEANRAQLVAAGVPAENVEVAGVCTMCRTDLLFSYRREGKGCGHFALLAGMPPSPPRLPILRGDASMHRNL